MGNPPSADLYYRRDPTRAELFNSRPLINAQHICKRKYPTRRHEAKTENTKVKINDNYLENQEDSHYKKLKGLKIYLHFKIKIPNLAPIINTTVKTRINFMQEVPYFALPGLLFIE